MKYLKFKDFTLVNDCFQIEYNEVFGVFLQRLFIVFEGIDGSEKSTPHSSSFKPTACSRKFATCGSQSSRCNEEANIHAKNTGVDCVYRANFRFRGTKLWFF